MKDFKEALISKGFASRTIKDALMRVSLFDYWLKENGFSYSRFTYAKVLDYIGHLQAQGKSKNSINTSLRILEHYYHYLKLPNSFLNVRQRGVYKESALLFNAQDLEAIYWNYKEALTKGYFRYSNHLILGLIVYQGLEESEIFRIQLSDIDLEKGCLYIGSGSRRKTSRTVGLASHQIMTFYKYLSFYRGIAHPLQRSNPESSEKLLSPNCDKAHRLHDQLKILIKTIKAQNPEKKIKKLTQLSQSRIGVWIECYGLRKAQYLSGYKSIGNVERYKGMDMGDLSLQIEKFHPLQ